MVSFNTVFRGNLFEVVNHHKKSETPKILMCSLLWHITKEIFTEPQKFYDVVPKYKS
jgi:hypothetical protein